MLLVNPVMSEARSINVAWDPAADGAPAPGLNDSIGVLVSGGVDSSVALSRLVAAGYRNVSAWYLKIWLEDELTSLGQCPWEEDLEYARSVCKALGVRLNVVSLQIEYYDRVVSYTIEELRAGRTPSPDIFCNERVKFGAFLERVGERVEWVASGHYGRVVPAPGRVVRAPGRGGHAAVSRGGDGDSYRIAHRPGMESGKSERVHLYRACDPVKDQSYFLSHLSQEQLARLLFPLGTLPKRQVRRLADRLQLANRNRPDSQGICFLGKIRYPDFVRHYLGEREGRIVDRERGRELGRHRGFWFYTIGQRQGLGLSGGPWYVTGKDVEENVVFVTHGDRVNDSASDTVRLEELHWIGAPPEDPGERGLSVKLRHGPKRIACSATGFDSAGRRLDELGASHHITLKLEEPDRGVAPGQFGVLYSGERCLGAGRIACGDVAGSPDMVHYSERGARV